MENHHAMNGKIHYFDWAIFYVANCKRLPEGIHSTRGKWPIYKIDDLPIKNGWIFYGKLLNFQRVYVVQPHPEIPPRCPLRYMISGEVHKGPAENTLGYALRCVWGCLQTHTRLGVIREVQHISGVMGNVHIPIATAG